MICKKCNQEKGEDFRKGHQACRDCERDYSRKWYYDNPERAYIKTRKYYQDHKSELSEYNKNWRLENLDYRNDYEKSRAEQYPEKIKAKTAIMNALRSGQILKPDRCEICKATVKIEAHHQDYSKPLTVDWLCKKCHLRVHSIVKDVVAIAMRQEQIAES